MRGAKKYIWLVVAIYVVCILYFSITISPLPYSARKEVLPFTSPTVERTDAFVWQKKLEDESIKVMATGKMGPLFSSRRYFYNFSNRYDLADYIVLSREDAYNGYESSRTKLAYEQLVNDERFVNIYKNGIFEVYKKL